jgi:Ser/Thr protein kinase RdoA (MazF antagonist)
MKPFDHLTPLGKARRLRTLALRALEQYPFQVQDIRLVGVFTNTLFRVWSGSGSSYLLRICRPGWRTDTDLRSEVMWLQALRRETDIGAPEPQPARNGDFMVQAAIETVPEARCCMLLSWIPGTVLGKQLTETNLYLMGILFARLHAQAAGFSPPLGFTQRKMDRLYAREEADVLFSPAHQDAFTPWSRAIFEQTRARVLEAYARRYADPAGLRVIHNDLWHDNIKIYRGRLHPLDFEDTVWGYPVQDMAMALQDLMLAVPPERFEPLQSAFRQGYESLAAWPETYQGEIDIFRAGGCCGWRIMSPASSGIICARTWTGWLHSWSGFWRRGC